MIDENLLYECLQRLFKKGGHYADIYYEKTESTSITLDNNLVEKAISGFNEGIGIRLIDKRNKTYFAYCNDLDKKNLYYMVENLSSISKDMQRDTFIDLNYKTPLINWVIKKPISSVILETKTEMLLEANKIVRAMDANIKQVRAIYSDLLKKIKILNSDGVIANDERSYINSMVEVVVTDGKELQTGTEVIGGMTGFEIFDENDFVESSKIAAKRALMMIKAPKIKGGRMPVVISSSAGGTMIHEAVGHSLEADLTMQGLSIYSNRLGDKIATDKITVIDDGTLEGKRGSYRFDDEGNYSQRNILIEKGILKAYLSDKVNSLKYNIPITGNGRRESYKSLPIPRMTNTYLAPGEDNPEEILKDTYKGIFVKKMGGGQVNTVTGEFVFDVQEGYVIEKGSLGHPVRSVTLIGSGQEVMQNIDRIGSDLGFSIGTCGKDGQGVPVSDALPTIRILEMVVGGEAG
ncbi:MAG TPA: TldD/PmbA family protein [Nitrospirae bacterium]|nr:TldD/PmbA family protein [Nitrospirota bacterium]